MPAPPAPVGWHRPSNRVPRRGQLVRVVTVRGTSHRARFAVVHTEAWPSGASWALGDAATPLPFADVALWSADPDAAPPVARTAAAPPPPEEKPAARPPAVLDELEAELDRTESVLHLLPADRSGWSPHPDIPPPRLLAWRLVRVVTRIGWILDLDGVDLSLEPDLPDLRTPGEIVQVYKANAEDVRRAAAGLDAAALRAPWRLGQHAATLLELPRGDALRRFGLTPLVYHRGEVALLLTALGIAVPHPYQLWPISDPPVSGPPS